MDGSIKQNLNSVQELLLSAFRHMSTAVIIVNSKLEIILSNEGAHKLFGCTSENEFAQKFRGLSPLYQPDGTLSAEGFVQHAADAYRDGRTVTDWIHCDVNQVPLPCIVTLVKSEITDEYGKCLMIGYVDKRVELLPIGVEPSGDAKGSVAMDDTILPCDIWLEEFKGVSGISDKSLFNIISQLSDDLFFVFDIEKSMIQYFGKMCHIMNVPEGKTLFPQAVIETNYVWSEDVPKLLKMVKNMEKGIYVPMDIRFRAVGGVYHYYRYVYQIMFDHDNKPIFAAGKVADIQEQRDLKIQATTDLLTMCYNKVTTETKITSIFSVSENEEEHALLIVDIDNFKEVNDNLGHYFGDLVLTEVASNLKSHFRKEDVVGRIGGDEFIVLLKNSSDMDIVGNKAQDIISSFFKTYAGENAEYTISASVGIARFPLDGNTYTQLYKSADKALYESKKKGKNCYTFYSESLFDGTMNNTTPYANANRTANIYFDAELASTLFDMLYASKNRKTDINTALGMLGKQLSVDRCYIFESFDNGDTYDNTYEWCGDGLSAEIENLQGLTKEVLAAFFIDANKHGIVYSNDLTILADEDAFNIMADLNIKSFLHSQTKANGFVKEFMGVDDCRKSRIWSEKEINTILYIRKIISVFLLIENGREPHYKE